MSRTKPLEGHPRYQEVKALNSGTFGSVYLAWDKQNKRHVAVKIMDRGPTITHNVQRELETHSLMNHAHIIKFREVFLTRYHLGIVLEYADGGDCYDYVIKRKRLSENKARWLFQQLVVAIDYLHLMKVANRDIKLENTLLAGDPEQPLVKICDLGYAKSEDMHSVPNSMVGTAAYLAPEVMTEKAYNGYKADIWSMGVMLYVMLVGQYPFARPADNKSPPHMREKLMMNRILKADYKIPESIVVSAECHDLLTKILVVDPDRRYTIAQIQAHPWYQLYLPDGVTEMNKNLTPNQTAQSSEELSRIVREAMRVGGPMNYDHMVDAAMRA